MSELTHLSPFSGIGGLDLAAEMAGFKTVGQCEWADYPTKVLEKHWPDVPRWRDIRTLTKDSFYERTGLRTVDVVSGGFPCQPFSVAGERRGKDDDRYLWPEMLRVIRELRPSWVIGENVPGIVNLALDEVLTDLESVGYEAQPFIIPACGVDAPHRRYRVAILAHVMCERLRIRGTQETPSDDGGKRDADIGRDEAALVWKRRQDKPTMGRMADGIRTTVHETVADPGGIGCEYVCKNTVLDSEDTDCSCRERERERIQFPTERTGGSHSPWKNWPTEPGVGRVVDGVPNRVDRIKCLGNAVVPQQFYIFFKLIADIERSKQ